MKLLYMQADIDAPQKLFHDNKSALVQHLPCFPEKNEFLRD